MTGKPYEKRPKRGRGWEEIPVPSPIWQNPPHPIVASAWRRGPVSVITTLVMADLPGGNGVGLTWNASITRMRKRPKPADVQRFRLDFDMMVAEEDNHHPGNARHFFLPVDPAFRGICECKANEDTFTEPDGYTWTNPTDNDLESCRGCESARLTRRPCPKHGFTIMGVDPGTGPAEIGIVIDDPIRPERIELAPAGQAALAEWFERVWPGVPVKHEGG